MSIMTLLTQFQRQGNPDRIARASIHGGWAALLQRLAMVHVKPLPFRDSGRQ